MNLSCIACPQSASDRCSITPPGAEPALLTMMSTRPSALAPCATKFLASSSLVRSAVNAWILRPVALAISAALASSGSLRRAQIAMSTPSLASASAIPLPMPSLPPVTSAVLPVSFRSMVFSSGRALMNPQRSRRRSMRHPRPGFGGRKQIGAGGVEHRRLLAGDGMARARHDKQPARRHRPLEEQTALEAREILVADHHEGRHGELLQIGFHLPQGRPLELDVQHGE